ncbi:hypothetical protein LZ32DRAFT_46551 [Colletotrichum eremochloae]|nr:hypothetical protein LZ32DRAFT_46551 [Colletotrichum eremochloae]
MLQPTCPSLVLPRQEKHKCTYWQLCLDKTHISEPRRLFTHAHAHAHTHTHTLSLSLSPPFSPLFRKAHYSPSLLVDITRAVPSSRRLTRLTRARGPANASLHQPRTPNQNRVAHVHLHSPVPRTLFLYPLRLPGILDFPPIPRYPRILTLFSGSSLSNRVPPPDSLDVASPSKLSPLNQLSLSRPQFHVNRLLPTSHGAFQYRPFSIAPKPEGVRGVHFHWAVSKTGWAFPSGFSNA